MEKFKQKVLQDPTLADQFKAVSSPDALVNLAVQLGQKLGYNFTTDEVKTALAQYSPSGSLELSDAHLKSIAGAGNTDYGCSGTDC